MIVTLLPILQSQPDIRSANGPLVLAIALILIFLIGLFNGLISGHDDDEGDC